MKQFFLLMVCGLLSAAQCEVSTDYAPPRELPPYRLVVSPNPKANIAVVGIVPMDVKTKKLKHITKSEACALASFLQKEIKKTHVFQSTLIFVFKSEDYASRLRSYQNKRRGANLTAKGYRQLTHLWKDVPVCTVFLEEKATYYYPQDNPTSWWKPLVQKPKDKTTTR